MVDVDVYEHVENYEIFQNLRPDYIKAINTSIGLALKYTGGARNIMVSDFCSGTGSNTKKYAELVGGVKKAALVDINKSFLEIAQSSNIKAKTLMAVNNDILKIKPNPESDIVFSIFAYHHITNPKKKAYLNKVKESLKTGGILIFTEIFLPTKELCLKYYNKLLNEIPKNKIVPGLEVFLKQTAESNYFEFKVSKEFADKQLKESGFIKIEEIKIWPLDNSFEKDIGTFVQVYKLK